MRIVLFVVLALTLLFSAAAVAQQQPAQSYSRPSFPPQSYAPQSYAAPSYAPQGFVPQADPASSQNRQPPRLRLFRCLVDDDSGHFCAFTTARNLSRGDPCSCDGLQGSLY